ncbi:unnamed protein product [Microthlaspi erraticum]|uniref:Uncharacterized protein n=1 Tax=Microthlaspi erraticum TaxID=1685480 RepID=A0A6D2L962_9BRAS|nr:unnamed protein product [Microthlaspi erraticum]
MTKKTEKPKNYKQKLRLNENYKADQTKDKIGTQQRPPEKPRQRNTDSSQKFGNSCCCRSSKELESSSSLPRATATPRPVLKTSKEESPIASPKTNTKTPPPQRITVQPAAREHLRTVREAASDHQSRAFDYEKHLTEAPWTPNARSPPLSSTVIPQEQNGANPPPDGPDRCPTMSHRQNATERQTKLQPKHTSRGEEGHPERFEGKRDGANLVEFDWINLILFSYCVCLLTLYMMFAI